MKEKDEIQTSKKRVQKPIIKSVPQKTSEEKYIDATISQITILSSDNAILSRGALQTIENLSTKFPHPKKDLTLTLPISYHLKY